MEKSRLGRPSVMTKTVREAVLNALRRGRSRMAAASEANVSYDSLKRLSVADEAFNAAILSAEAEYEGKCIDALTSAMPDSWQAAAWWLERRRPRVYGKQERLTVLRDVARDISQLSDEELAALAYGDDDEGEGTVAADS